MVMMVPMGGEVREIRVAPLRVMHHWVIRETREPLEVQVLGVREERAVV
jgi:hypothetical protein